MASGKTELDKVGVALKVVANDKGEPAILSLPLRKQLYDHYMTDAMRWVQRLQESPAAARKTLTGDLEELQFFSLPE